MKIMDFPHLKPSYNIKLKGEKYMVKKMLLQTANFKYHSHCDYSSSFFAYERFAQMDF